MNEIRNGATGDEPEVIHTWTARRIRPFVLAGVVLVFAAFAALAHFVFHSPEAVKALGMACIGSLGGVVPGVLLRSEYRLTEAGLDRRPFRPKDPRKFEPVFTWAELDRVAATSQGFKFYRPIPDRRAIDRWWKTWFSARHSGEFQVEKPDREAVREACRAQGIAVG